MVCDGVVSVKNSNPCPYSLRDLEGSYVVHTSGRDAEMLEAPEENDHRGLSPSDVAIMPRDLAATVSRENAAFVHEKTRRALLSKLEQARKRCGREIKPESWKLFLASVALSGRPNQH